MSDIPDTTPSGSPDPREPDRAVLQLVETRARLVAGEPDARSAGLLADATDDCVRALCARAVQQADPGKAWAVAALGGYGAGRLLPYSDIDVLFATEAPGDRLKPFVQAVLYPLWDAGLKVGHSVRGRRQALAAAREDTANRTALLSARLVAGSPQAFERVVGSVLARSARDASVVLAELVSRERPGTPFDLWPDLKEGRGGQRDIDELLWMAAVRLGRVPQSLEHAFGALRLDSDDAPSLSVAQDTITVARWVAHVAHGRGDNKWDEECDAAAPRSADGLADALALVDGVLRCARSRIPLPGPATSSSAQSLPLPSGARDFIDALASGTHDAEALQTAAWRGAIDTAVPGFSRVMGLRRPALSHRLTVGAHSVLAATLVTSTAVSDPRAAAILEALPDIRPLLAAALLHDIGKRTDAGDHALAGAPIAREAALRLGLDGPQAMQVATLVRDHLLLADTATACDLDDEDVVLAAASRLADPLLVGPLYVLTVADALATGPDVWTEWRAALVGQLAGRLERVLQGTAATDLAPKAEAVRREVLEAARFEQVPSAIAEFVARAPVRYLAERPAAEVLADAKLAFTLAQGSRADAARSAVRAGPLPGTWRVTVVALDRPGLLALLAGVLALSGLDILAVSAHTTSLGVALDTFTVTAAMLAQVDHSTWATFDRSLAAALDGRLSVAVRLAERRRHYRPSERRSRPRVTIDTDTDFATAIVVRAPDRVGLLHDLALAVARSGLDIRSVTAVSADGVAKDTFQVLDEFGETIHDEARMVGLARTLTLAAAGNPNVDGAPSEES